MKLLDTTIAVDHLLGEDRATHLLNQMVEDDEPLLASELTRFELLAGVLQGEVEATETFFGAMSWVPVDEQISRMAGALAARFRQSHSGIDTVDYVIAATALVIGADLVTTNVRHFPMVQGLEAPYDG